MILFIAYDDNFFLTPFLLCRHSLSNLKMSWKNQMPTMDNSKRLLWSSMNWSISLRRLNRFSKKYNNIFLIFSIHRSINTNKKGKYLLFQSFFAIEQTIIFLNYHNFKYFLCHFVKYLRWKLPYLYNMTTPDRA